jgi:uncharacterized protein
MSQPTDHIWPEHIRGVTFHGRKGAVENAFRYGVDYLLIDPESHAGPALFSRNRGNLTSLWDLDHGGAPHAGRGVVWLQEVLAAYGLPPAERVELLAQARVLGHVFNPVSFWLCYDGEGLRVVVAEVSNTYGDRHCYLCHRDDLAPLTALDHLRAKKVFHVSPFQEIAGEYRFRFDITAARIGIWIEYQHPGGSLMATLTGRRQRLSNRGILAACLRRPFGSRRVLALIHWQALKLWWKGARFRARPVPPVEEVTR